MVSVCLPSDALSQHLLSYLGFSYLGQGVSPHAAPPDLEHGVAPLGPPALAQPPLLGHGVKLFVSHLDLEEQVSALQALWMALGSP